MLENILEKIEALPPLPQTIEDIEIFKKKKNKEVDELVKIIEKDPLVITTLLKVSNSSLFGFRSKVETVSRVVNLLGINFTIYVVISETVNNILTTDLSPYGIESSDFMEASIASSNLVNLWLGKINNDLKEEVLLASILQETGKFILSELLIGRNLTEEFIRLIESGLSIKDAEKKLLGITTSEVTAEIFKYWNLGNELVNMIRFVDNIDSCPSEFKLRAQILDVVKILCESKKLFVNVEKALNKAIEYNLEIEPLKEAIKILQARQ